MPSSISSSDRTVPGGPWLRVWVLSLALTLSALGGLETFWRHNGQRPSIVDDPAWWSYQRDRAATNDPKTVVLLGASRIQLDFSMELFARLYPRYEAVQLAIDGRHPLAALRDLAEDESFKGVVLCDLTPPSFLRATRDEQQEYVDYRRAKGNLNRFLNRLIASWIQERFAIVNPQVNLRDVGVRYLIARKLPRPLYLITRFDRSRAADYALIDVEKQRRFRVERLRHGFEANPPPTPEQWLEQALDVEPWIQRIQARGGQVVFACLPTSGEYGALEGAYYPKTLYWDRFAVATGARTLHFRDYPDLSDFECPDGSHLDQRDKERFTVALLARLSSMGVLETAGAPTAGGNLARDDDHPPSSAK